MSFLKIVFKIVHKLVLFSESVVSEIDLELVFRNLEFDIRDFTHMFDHFPFLI